MDKKAGIILGVVIVLVLIVVAVLISIRHKKEGYSHCICSSNEGGRQKNCQDDILVNKLYNEGILTEYTDLPSKGWSTDSPGDSMFPQDEGCNTDQPKKGWVSWDFDDF